jgi:hypothetical protein
VKHDSLDLAVSSKSDSEMKAVAFVRADCVQFQLMFFLGFRRLKFIL